MSNETAIKMDDCQLVEFGNDWREYYPVLIKKARFLTAGGAQDPEDLVSQATVKVLNYLTLERKVENFVGLMLVSLLQVYQDSNRRLSNRVFDRAAEYIDDQGAWPTQDFLPCVERSYIAKETLGDIFDYLTTLPKASQELFHLRFVMDLAYFEIAKRKNISEANARQKVRKLRLNLQLWMKKNTQNSSRFQKRHVNLNESNI